MKRSVDALDWRALEGQRALVRVDFNVPMTDGAVGDDTRMRAALPTISWLRGHGCRVVLVSHLGRPKGKPRPELSLRPVAAALEEMLGIPVSFVDDPTDQSAAHATRRMRRGEVTMIENLRFWPGEEANDPVFAKHLAALGDFYVNDAFGTAHRAHASTAAVAGLLGPAVAGMLMARELEHLGNVVARPVRPFVAVIGGAKISGKIDVIEALLPKVDSIIIGGAMANTFFLALGYEVGNSLVEPDRVEMAKRLLEQAGPKLVLPKGVAAADKLVAGAEFVECAADGLPPELAVYDIDAATGEDFAVLIRGAKTVLWNGPMGVFETPPFDRGTLAVARALADATRSGARTVVGGGDSVAALVQAGLEQSVTHVSTGGGASLEFLEGKDLPGVSALDDA